MQYFFRKELETFFNQVPEEEFENILQLKTEGEFHALLKQYRLERHFPESTLRRHIWSMVHLEVLEKLGR